MPFVVSLCMSPKILGYRELGLELVELGEEHSHHTKKPPMAKEKRDDRVIYHIKLLLKEALMQERNMMMDNFI
jgi:hypothetical protein